MKNPLKRPLPGKPNKYSSGGVGSKKRGLNVRPPQPASVARLESILDGATKKKKKLKHGSEIANRKSKDGVTGNIRETQVEPGSTRMARIGKDGTWTDATRMSTSRSAAALRRQGSNENTRNKARDGDDRWSHVNSSSKSKHRPKVVNPFLLEINQPKRTSQNVKGAKSEVSKFAKAAKLPGGPSLSGTKNDGETRKHSMKRKEFSTDDDRAGMDVIGNTITPKKITKPPASYIESNENNCCNSFENQANSLPEQLSSNDVRNKPTISEDLRLSTQEKNDQKATPLTDVKCSSVENKDISIASGSSLRPKLGLRLGNKTTKRNSSSVTVSSFHRSRRVTSSPSDFQRTLPVSDAGHGAQEEKLPVVLDSPGKSNPALSLQHDSLNDENFLASDMSVGDEISRETLKAHNDTTATINASTNKKSTKTTRKKTNINDNFVRLNMKNNAGACRGAKNKSSKYSKERRSWNFRGEAENREGGRLLGHAPMGSFANPTLTFDTPFSSTSSSFSDSINMQNSEDVEGERRGGRFSRSSEFNNSKSNAASYVSKMSGLDPLDEFVDGTFHYSGTKREKADTKNSLTSSSTTPSTSTSVYGGSMIPEAPKCARHQRPCKLIKVKKATTGNKGREFYACSMPRGEQCDHFQWADDTVEAARCTIAKNSSYSSFITRQVAAYVDRFRTLTVPELKEETSRRGLNKNGKKQQLLMRLAIWTRDELVKCSPELANKETEDESESNYGNSGAMYCEEAHDDEDSDSECSSSSSSEDELELFDGAEDSRGEDADTDNEKLCSENNDAIVREKDRSIDSDSSLTASLREIFGHDSFRDGQEWAVQRCLDQKPSLLIAPTGFGKSLCYALPAALMDGVCIVVSPLISLIQDQLRSLPPRIPAATLSGSVSAAKTAAIIDDIVRKRLKILFVSPERLTSPAFRRLFNLTWNPETNTKERKFPEISLLCIDEAHCISQWAHNFRPCFLRFKGFLKTMKPKSILAITATAGPRVIQDIGQTLGMDFPESITEESPKTAMEAECDSIKIIRTGRDNIDVMGKFMSSQEERLAVVASILTPAGVSGNNNKNPYAGKLATGSTIVYVWRQKDTEVVAESLRAAGVSGGVVVYHGGMDANARAKSQNKFMRGKARICVATVAFGLGIDKADIVGIVHLYLSNSPEHYLQEIGRAGRDGRAATAIALPLLEEVPTRHSLSYSNLVAKSQIGALLRIIRRLVTSSGRACDMDNSNCGRPLHVALPVQSTVRACDCKPETIETFLSLIERIGGDNPLLQIEGYNYDAAAIAMKKRTLKKLAEREPVAVSIEAVSQCVDAPLSGAAAGTEKVNRTALPTSFQKQFLAYSKGSHSFSISQCANQLGPTAEPRHVFAALRRLQSSNELEFVLDTSEKGRIFQLKVSEMGYKIFNSDEYSEMEERLVATIFESFSSSSDSGATKLLDMHYILDQVAIASKFPTDEDADEQLSSSDKSQSLHRFQELTGKYFGKGLESERLAAKGLLPESFSVIREKELKIDALSLLRDLPPLFQQSRFSNDRNATSENDLPPEFLKLEDHSRIDYAALAITKFLHGMDTPRTPLLTFRQYPLYGKWKTVDFRLVHDLIQKVMHRGSK